LGKVFDDLRDLTAAAFGRAAVMLEVAARGDGASVRCDQSLVLLAVGNLYVGWPAHEARLDAAQMGHRALPSPRWAGESLEGCRFLVQFEQGYTDMV